MIPIRGGVARPKGLEALTGSSQRSWEWVRDPADTPG
jgi:hypothetical protein